MHSTAATPGLNFDDPDYCDHFVLTPGDACTSIEDFVERLALRQPGWLTRVSMGISGRAALELGVADALQGGAIGNWQVLDRTERSITFGEDMRILRYRVTYDLDGPTKISARTEVVQQTRWFGPIYWLLATPLHRQFLQMMLRRAGGPGSTTHAG